MPPNTRTLKGQSYSTKRWANLAWPKGSKLSGFSTKHEDGIIEMYVQDFGKGIDPRYHQSIFDRYFRVPGTKVQGSGLGLSISKDFVEAHGGTLTVESELGKGSRFVIRLKG